MRCLIVEDEPLAMERLTGYVQQLPMLTLAGAFDNAPEALSFLLANDVDLLLLDISLGGMSGIELLETSAVNCQVILTTAHSEFAIKSYDLKVADYLLKPFTFARFVQAVERATSAVARPTPVNDKAFLFVKTEFRLERVQLAELLFIEGSGDYRVLHTTTKRIKTLETLADLEARLPPSVACRVHKSYIVAIDKVESVERDRIMIRNTFIPISATYRARFYALIGFGFA